MDSKRSLKKCVSFSIFPFMHLSVKNVNCKNFLINKAFCYKGGFSLTLYGSSNSKRSHVYLAYQKETLNCKVLNQCILNKDEGKWSKLFMLEENSVGI